MFVLDNASSSHTQSPCPCLSASASMPHARGETHASATRADLPSPKRPGSVDGAGPALFIPDQDIRACLSVARSAWVHRPARVEESRWSRAPSDFRGSSLRLAARRADPQDRTPFVCGRRFPAPRIARTEEIARGGDGEGPLRVVDHFFFWQVVPSRQQRVESFRAPLPRAPHRARLSPLRILPPEKFYCVCPADPYGCQSGRPGSARTPWVTASGGPRGKSRNSPDSSPPRWIGVPAAWNQKGNQTGKQA